LIGLAWQAYGLALSAMPCQTGASAKNSSDEDLTQDKLAIVSGPSLFSAEKPSQTDAQNAYPAASHFPGTRAVTTARMGAG